MEDDKRFILTDNHKENFIVPIKDNLLRPECDKMFITKVVSELNYLNRLCKELWEENRQLRKENNWLKESNKTLGKIAYPLQKYIGEDKNE